MIKSNRKFPIAVSNAFKAAGVSCATTLMVAFLFG